MVDTFVLWWVNIVGGCVVTDNRYRGLKAAVVVEARNEWCKMPKQGKEQ